MPSDRSAPSGAWPYLTYLDTLEAVMTGLKEVHVDLKAYERYRDLGMLWSAVRSRMTFLFQALGYALGHADWAVLEEGAEPELRVRYERRLDELRALPFG